MAFSKNSRLPGPPSNDENRPRGDVPQCRPAPFSMQGASRHETTDRPACASTHRCARSSTAGRFETILMEYNERILQNTVINSRRAIPGERLPAGRMEIRAGSGACCEQSGPRGQRAVLRSQPVRVHGLRVAGAGRYVRFGAGGPGTPGCCRLASGVEPPSPRGWRCTSGPFENGQVPPSGPASGCRAGRCGWVVKDRLRWSAP